MVEGIDVDEKSVNEARKYCHAYVLDLLKEEIKGEYDVIILGDILEHLVNPEEVFLKLKENFVGHSQSLAFVTIKRTSFQNIL